MISVLAATATEEKKSRKEIREERRATQVEQTKNLIESNAWHFEATQMLPTRGQSRSIMNYHVLIEDGKLNSYLPYFGRAYSAGYSAGGDSPLIFESTIEDYKVTETKNGAYRITFTSNNRGDRISYTLNVSSSGSASLSVQSSKRQHISYSGNLVPLAEAVV